MIKIFSLVFDLLQLPITPEYTQFAEKLIDNPTTKIVNFHPQWFIFLAFQDLLLKKITQEDFVALGDSFWVLQKYQILYPLHVFESLQYWLENDPQQYTNCSILIEKKNQKIVENNFPMLEKQLKDKKSQIIFL